MTDTRMGMDHHRLHSHLALIIPSILVGLMRIEYADDNGARFFCSSTGTRNDSGAR